VLDELVVRAGDRAVLVTGALVEVDPVQRADLVAAAELGQRPALARLLLPLQQNARPRHAAGGLTGLEAGDGHGELLVDTGKMSTRTYERVPTHLAGFGKRSEPSSEDPQLRRRVRRVGRSLSA
jgi:hypothetical protein